MPVSVDQLKTVMAVAGQQTYMNAMFAAARATTNLERVTVNANKRMGESADAYYDKQANRYRDRESGQFLSNKSMMGLSNPVAAIATVAAAEIAVLAGVLRLGAAAFKETTDAGRKFEAAMKDVEIQSGASAREMEKIKNAALSEDLMNLGVGGTAAASAYKLLAAEGYNAAQMQEAMIPITETAIATGSDQVAVTRGMLAIMRQYKLEITDLPAIGDAMTAALNKTTFQMDDLMLAMKYAGPIAGSLGWSFGETVAMLNVLIQQFGNAEMTGTGFRGVMNTLMAPSAEAAAAFKEAGLEISDYNKVMGDSVATMEWLKSGTWSTDMIMRAFGAEAGNAATVLIGTAIPAMKEVGDAINTTGNVTKDAQNKVASLDGAILQLTASYENLKIWLSTVSNGLSVDFVKAITLATQTVAKYLSETRTQLSLTDSSMAGNRDRVLEMAEAFISGSAMVARGAIQVSRVLAMQAAQLTSLAFTYAAARVAWLELAYAWAWVNNDQEKKDDLSERIDNAKAAAVQLAHAQGAMMKWALGGGATAMIAEVDNLEKQMLEKARAMREKYLAEAKKAETGKGTPMPAKGGGGVKPNATIGPLPAEVAGVPNAITQATDIKAAQDALNIAKAYLGVWERMQKGQANGAGQEAQIELMARQQELKLLQAMEQTTYRLTTEAKAREQATIARQGAEAAVMEARKRGEEATLSTYQEALQLEQKRLRIWAEGAKANAKSPAEEAAVELALKEKELELARQMEQITYRMTGDVQKRQEAMLARAQAEADLAGAQKKVREDMAKANEKDRRQTATEMERLAKAQNAVNDAVQMVIGGSLSELAREQIDRLNRVGDAKGFTSGGRGWLDGVKVNPNKTITLLLKADGELTDQQMNQVVNTLVPAIQQAGQRPAFGN